MNYKTTSLCWKVGFASGNIVQAKSNAFNILNLLTMRCIKTLLLITVASYQSLCQELPKEFGKITDQEWEMTAYEKDKEAEAVILFDIGESVFYETEKGGYDIRFTRIKRIKIFKKDGLKYANIDIPFYTDGYGKTERVGSIEAYTYNIEEGRHMRDKLDEESIFTEKINERWNLKKFTLPDVREGSIIEYRYVLETPFHFNLPDWKFQDEIPTIYSSYTANMVPFYDYVFIAQGIKKFNEQTSKLSEEERAFGTVVKTRGQNVGNGFEFQDMIYKYVMKDTPAFKDESFITSIDDYIMKIDFQLSKFHSPSGGEKEIMTTWPQLIDELLKHEKFGKYIKKSRKYAKEILETDLVKGDQNKDQYYKAIIEYVKKRFSWNKKYGKYTTKSPKELLSDNTGNPAEINLFLYALLMEAGANAYPIILSTRNNGKVRVDYPFIHFFNYVIVFVEGEKSYLSDGTDKVTLFNRVPIRCINEYGLIVSNSRPEWVNLEAQIVSTNTKKLRITIDTLNKTANVSASISLMENEAYRYKKSFGDNISLIEEQFIKKGIDEINTVETSNFFSLEKAYNIKVKGEAEVQKNDNKIFFKPFLNFFPDKNIFSLEERMYPVDFIYPKLEKINSMIEIPNGYTLEELPKDFELNDELAHISVTYKKTSNLLSVSGVFHLKKSVYPSEDYKLLKKHFDYLVENFNTRILIEKI